MASKKQAVGLIIILGVFLIPVVFYGPTVSVADVTVTVSVSSDGGLLVAGVPSLENSVMQQQNFTVKLDGVDVTLRSELVYLYMYYNLLEPVVYSTETSGHNIVNFTISLTITTPSNVVLTQKYEPPLFQAPGVYNTTIRLGPDALNQEHGEFSVSATVHLILYPPQTMVPTLEVDLGPSVVGFTIP
jgi:hypothetical protein